MAKSDYEFSDVLISPREPYDKKTVWIHPQTDNIEVKIFDKGWRLLSQTKDLGLSIKAKEQVEKTLEELKVLLIDILKKQLGKFSSNADALYNKQKTLEEKMQVLEDKFDKLNKKYSVIKYGGK